MAGQSKAFPGHLERRLMTGTPRGENRELVPINGGITSPFPVTFGGFGMMDPIQSAIDIFKSSLWMKLLVIGGTVALLYYTSKRTERRW